MNGMPSGPAQQAQPPQKQQPLLMSSSKQQASCRYGASCAEPSAVQCDTTGHRLAPQWMH